MRIPLLAFIIQGIPEQIALVTLASVLAKVTLKWKRILIFGLILALSSYVIRLFPSTFGVHTLVLVIFLFLLFVKSCNATVEDSLRASLISVLVLIILETALINLYTGIFNISLATILNDLNTRILLSLPQVFILFLLAFLVNKYLGSKMK